jgi:hypothetical protein
MMMNKAFLDKVRKKRNEMTPYDPQVVFKSKNIEHRPNNLTSDPFGIKLVSRDKLLQTQGNSKTRANKTIDDSIGRAIAILSKPIAPEDQPIDSFLDGDIYTNPKFKKDKLKAEKLLKLRYENGNDMKDKDNGPLVSRSLMGDIKSLESWKQKLL